MDKLQELTEKLYNEGLAKGKAEGETIVQNARKEAEEIVNKAKEEAQAIIDKATKEAADFKIKVQGDVKMASVQSLQATRTEIENLIIAKAAEEPASKALSNPDFIKDIIKEVASHFNAQESADLEIILPEKLRKEVEPFVKGELASALGKGVEASFSKKIDGGFKIGPKDGSYFISLTDESFAQLIGSYLRPATKQLLFGNE